MTDEHVGGEVIGATVGGVTVLSDRTILSLDLPNGNVVNVTVPKETTIYEPIAGYCGFENEDGEIAIAPGDP